MKKSPPKRAHYRGRPSTFPCEAGRVGQKREFFGMYAHNDGDSWDYLLIWPITTPEQDRKLDELAARKGLKTGFAASLEFRQMLSSHTDTFASGPMTASELVAAAEK